MEYLRFDPGTRSFPKPKVPALPTLGRRSLQFGSSPAKAFARSPSARFYARARYALADAYRLSGVNANTALLAPAYHCLTMLDPAIRLGAEVGLYPLRPDLTPDLDGLMACLANCGKRVTALLVTHFFGFPQPLQSLLAFCAKHDIALIEDCSHCLIVQPDASSLGRQGRYSVWSPYKFCPCEDGGVLWANHNAAMPSVQSRSAGLVQEIKGWAHVLQRLWTGGPLLDATSLDREIAALPDLSTPVCNDRLETAETPSNQYDPAFEGVESLAGSRWIMGRTDITRITERRRTNYRQWAQAVASLPHCQALFPTLPDGCVPYMFPLLIDHPEIHFIALKYLGLTEWRFDSMAVSTCRVAMAYRLRLLQLPCHQELTPTQLTWMTAAVTKVFTEIPAAPLESTNCPR